MGMCKVWERPVSNFMIDIFGCLKTAVVPTERWDSRDARNCQDTPFLTYQKKYENYERQL